MRSLNHFLNNLSSKLLKNFRWLKFDFSSNLNNLQNCPRCFLVRLHVIQFTRYSVVRWRSFRVRSQLLYVSTSIPLCQELFSNSSKLFKLCRCPPGKPFIRQLLHFSISNKICQPVFSDFHKNSFDLLFLPPLFPEPAYPITISPVCQPQMCQFFALFMRLFFFALRQAPFQNHLSVSHGRKHCC